MTFAEFDIVTLILRFALLIGSIASAGGVLFFATISGADTVRRAVRMQVFIGALTVLLVEPLRYVNFQSAISGGDFALAFDPSMRWLAFETAMGQAAALRFAAAIVLIAVGLRTPTLALGAASAMIISFALEGHTASHEGSRPLVAGLLIAHVAIAHWWLGALVPLRAAVRDHTPTQAAHLIEHFGSRAVAAVVFLVLAGGILLGLLTGWRVDLSSNYQSVFAAKIAGFAIIFGIAAFNKCLWTPLMRSDPSRGRRGLQNSLNVEIAMAGVIILATASATSVPPIP